MNLHQVHTQDLTGHRCEAEMQYWSGVGAARCLTVKSTVVGREAFSPYIATIAHLA
jgi:hypothetical protein